jgi:hypothetical protein
MSIEMELLSRIIRTGELNEVIDWGITEDDFRSPEALSLWRTLQIFHRDKDSVGSVLGENRVRSLYHEFVLCDDDNVTTEMLCNEVRKNRMALDIQAATRTGSELAMGDPYAAAAKIQSDMTAILDLDSGRKTDVYFRDAMVDIRDEYYLKRDGKLAVRVHWPWQPLDKETGGVADDEYCLLYGRPKSMKSWCLAAMIAFWYEMDLKVLVYTKEMTPTNIFKRVSACLSRVYYDGLRLGHMSPQEEIEFEQTCGMAMALPNDMVCLSGRDAPPSGDTIPWLRAKIAKHEPDIVAIDGLYLMSDVNKARKREERLTNISRDLRQLILDNAETVHPSPVVATLQANRKAAEHERGELDEIAYSDAFGQDVTMAARVINDKKGDTVSLVMAGTREFRMAGIRIHAIPAVNFSFHSELTEKEVERAKERDTADEEPKKKTNSKKKTAPSAELEATKKRVNKQFDR